MRSSTPEYHGGHTVIPPPPSKVFASRLAPDFASVRGALKSLSAWLDNNVCSADQSDRIELTVAEALNNVAEHGGVTSHQYITLFARQEPSAIRIVIRDQGKAYPGNALPKPKVQNALDLPEGGFGWMLIHTLADEVSYQRIEPGNVLTILFSVENTPDIRPIVPANCPKISTNRPQ